MIDVELVTRKMLLIARDLEVLGPIAAKDRTAYLATPLDEIVVERYLQRVIGRMIDINYHVTTEAGRPPPGDYHASFLALAELKILDREFAARIALSAGLRNRIVHEYNDIDPARVYEALQAAMKDIPVYLQKVSDYLARLSGDRTG